MSIYSYDTESPEWASMIHYLKDNGFKVSEIAESIGSTTAHVYMIMNGKRGENLNYTTGVRLLALFKANYTEGLRNEQ